jgi:thioredoxin reductase (NADPH)
VLAGEQAGGQLTLTTVVENFPGFPEGVDGPLLVQKMREQAEKFGTEVKEEKVVRVEEGKRGKRVVTTEGKYEAEAVLIATGAETVWLGVPGEKELIGRGVSSCAVCDAVFFRNKHTIVVGGGDAAMEDALALAKFAESVTIVHRRDSFRASKVMVDRVLSNKKIKVIWNSGVERVEGESKVSGVKLKNIITGEKSDFPVDGVFVAIGHKPTTEIVRGIVALDDRGYVKTDFGLTVPFPTMTSVEGIFAGGDCVDFKYRQAITASAFGVMAALDMERWLEK